MRRIMIIAKHLNNDPKEPANFSHLNNFIQKYEKL